MENSDIGLIGLAVMGANLARNLASKGIRTVVYNRTGEKTKKFINEFGHGACLSGAMNLEEFVSALKKPRKIILMIRAGESVDYMLGQLTPLLEKGDIVIDGGNSYFEDTRRRSKDMEKLGLHYVGMGVSGGEEGALHGPSLMPGGSPESYKELRPILEAIAAKAEGEPCVDYIGPDGAGHYVKTVHNGIEYADMQMISDVYMVMKHLLKMAPSEMAEVWDSWNKRELSSYLVEITANVLRKKEENGGALIDCILDVARQKGTGKWTSLSALDLGVPVPTITEAVFARHMSCCKKERLSLAEKYKNLKLENPVKDREAFLEDLYAALYGAKICAYAQGFNLLAAAGNHFNWDLHMGRIAKIWRNGCIIRAEFLDRVTESFDSNRDMTNLLESPYFAEILIRSRKGWGHVVSLAVENGIAVPALSSALAYFDSYRTAVSGANLLQGQRDYFGAHTYERVDKPGTFHTNWSLESKDR